MTEYLDEYYGDCEVCGTWCPPVEGTRPWRYLCHICMGKIRKNEFKRNIYGCIGFFNPENRYRNCE